MSTLENKTDTMHIRIEPIVKRESEEIFSRLGISTSYAFSLFLNQVILHDGFPFEINLSKEKDQDVNKLRELNERMGKDKVLKSNEKLIDLFINGDIDYETCEFAIKRSYIK